MDESGQDRAYRKQPQSQGIWSSLVCRRIAEIELSDKRLERVGPPQRDHYLSPPPNLSNGPENCACVYFSTHC